MIVDHHQLIKNMQFSFSLWKNSVTVLAFLAYELNYVLYASQCGQSYTLTDNRELKNIIADK